jgi:hypothetical protein
VIILLLINEIAQAEGQVHLPLPKKAGQNFHLGKGILKKPLVVIRLMGIVGIRKNAQYHGFNTHPFLLTAINT